MNKITLHTTEQLISEQLISEKLISEQLISEEEESVCALL
jgi:hypothetical protein